MMLGYRSDDAVITICQNNTVKSIEITELNTIAEVQLGYKAADLLKKPLHRVLPPRIGTLLEEYVEFHNDANDVGEVLSKVQSFSVLDKAGKEHGFRLKVVRIESSGEKIMFRLVLQDRMGERKNEALRKAIQDNFKGHEVMDRDLGLPDRNSLIKDIELVGYYNSKSDMRTCFAVLQLDHYDDLLAQYGSASVILMMKHVAVIARQNLRPDDVVGVIDPHRLGAVLLDTTPETARMVSNRLRWQIAANPFVLPNHTDVGLSVSIAFSGVNGSVNDKSLVENCINALSGLSAKSANALIEVENDDKRRSAL